MCDFGSQEIRELRIRATNNKGRKLWVHNIMTLRENPENIFHGHYS